MIRQFNAEKAFKIVHVHSCENHKKTRRGELPQPDKEQQAIANILYSKRLNAVPRWRGRKGRPLSPGLFSTMAEVPANAISQGKEIKDIQDWKGNKTVPISLFYVIII